MLCIYIYIYIVLNYWFIIIVLFIYSIFDDTIIAEIGFIQMCGVVWCVSSVVQSSPFMYYII